MELKSLIQSCHLNFLIGSGASFPFLKTLGDTEKILSDLDEENLAKEKREIIESSIMEEYFSNSIEGNLKIASDQSGDVKNSVLKDYKSFIKALNNILLHRKTTLLHKHVNIFTSNYDLFLEKACDELQVELNDGFRGRFSPQLDLSSYRKITSKSSSYYDIKSELPQFNVYKLHGSAGWKRDQENIIFDRKLTSLREIKESGLDNDLFLDVFEDDNLKSLDTLKNEADDVTHDEGHSKYIDLYGGLQIINPNKDKFRSTTLNYLYYELLRIYSNELEKQNSVLFVIGFSFADEHIREITLRALNSNPTLKVIVFAFNEEAEQEIKENLAKTSDGFTYDNLIYPDRGNSGNANEEKFNLSVVNNKYFKSLANELAKNLKI